ncbi:MAG: biotin--[acetyl-CoA-carboxylase] ligase [Planctomycetota bacterium]|nr:biotin--[acetyl-CoA-carboxylase] ligase [Planctomycetota bacterium]
MDTSAVEGATGWRIVHRPQTTSTNDDAAMLRDRGGAARSAVVADEQTAGRGRAGRSFASPEGGMYVSMLLGARPEDRPARVVALCAVALAEALELLGVARAEIKWPNDVWIERQKVAGILIESTDPNAPVVAGIGVNLAAVPTGLPPIVSAAVTFADAHVDQPVHRDTLLVRLLQRVDAWSSRLAGGDAEGLEQAWISRLALLGERVRLNYRGKPLSGLFEAASLEGGLLIRDEETGPVWREAALVTDLGPA